VTAAAEAAPEPRSGPGWAWAAWLLASLFFFYAFAQRVAPSVMVEELMADFAVGAAILGNLTAFYFYAYASLQIPIGFMLDRLGPRRLMTGGLLLAGFGSLVFAWGESILLAYVGRLLIGAGSAFSWVGALTVALQWFPPRRFAGLAGGTQAFGMAGAVFGQAPVAALVAIWGWRGALLALAVLAFALAASIWTVVRDRPAAPAHLAPSLSAGLRTVLAQRQTWLSGVFGMAMVAPTVAYGGLWAVPYLTQTQGMLRAEAAALTSIMFIGWGIGAPLLGLLSDRLGQRRWIMLTTAALSTALMAALPLTDGAPRWVIGTLMTVQGFAASSMVIGVALARESTTPQVSGTVLGVVNTFVVGSGALLQPLIGALLDLQWDGTMAGGARVYSASAYHHAFVVLPLIMAIGTITAALSRDVKR
jgi:MFS family permease